MTRHLAKALDAIWYLCMGLFLGLTAGLVLSVIMTFRGARAIDATPGVEPYSDPMFAEYHNDAVAGYIGQDLFMVGGKIALALVAVALLARISHSIVGWLGKFSMVGSILCSSIRFGAMAGCIWFLVMGAFVTLEMNRLWPELYEIESAISSRPIFDALHQSSERFVRCAWLLALISTIISPWCRRIADAPLQSGDGKEEVNQKEG